MNADALIGTVLGTCTLQKVIGQGGMGAVYLAQQSRPRRQVAVKVLLPATTLAPHQRVAFLERFRRETDAAASLEHPNILPVHEYGEENGLAYLVVPYISGGTLRDLMEIEGRLPFHKAVNYLEQLAAALDFAHEHKVIHRDIKPANILVTPEGRLLLTDFGLVKLIADGRSSQVRLTGAGAPVGTPDYMSPEQVIGETVSGRADLYSLGIILYQMLTGLTPFQGETPMHIASQQLQSPPPSPRFLRPDLPFEAEQVILRALAKRPADRFAFCQEFAEAFRNALTGAGVPLGNTQGSIGAISVGPSTSMRLFTPRGLFDPSWQTGAIATPGAMNGGLSPSLATNDFNMGKPTGVFPTAENTESPRRSGLLSRTGKFPIRGETGQLLFPPATSAPPDPYAWPEQAPVATGKLSSFMQPTATGTLPTFTNKLPTATGMQPVMMPGLNQMQMSPELSPVQYSTGALMVPGSKQGANSTVKLTGPVKVVQVPIAGQPGRYVTGLLPVASPLTNTSGELPNAKKSIKRSWKTIALSIVMLLAIIGASSVFLIMRTHQQNQAKTQGKPSPIATATPNAIATATAQVQATATAKAVANLLFKDPLTQNISNWPVGQNESFQNGSYVINNSNSQNKAVAVVLPGQNFSTDAYTLTMREVKGNDTSNNNSFGMIFRFNQQTKNGKTYSTFYSFEIVNMKGGYYRFYKYDDSQGSPNQYWTKLWEQPLGSEYHLGQGPNFTNTIRIYQNGSTFSFTVNGKLIKTVQDTSFKSGTLGMLVNLNGTEVAFKNLLVTRS